jgi:sulfoxide reductase heme-binding subunit YedZ
MSESNSLEIYLKLLAFTLLGAFALAFAALLFLLGPQPLQAAVSLFNALFALDSVQALWYLTRAAGLLAYLLLWLSTAWGLAVTSKIFDPLLHRTFTYDMHQYLSLLAIGFTVLHVGVLVADRYLPFSVAQILVPFIAPYRPLWVGVGVIGLYLTLLVTVTFYIRRWIGQKTFRTIHLASFLAYAAVTLHGLLAGTDSTLWAMQLIYAGTFLAVVFLTVYWVAFNWLDRRDKPRLDMGRRRFVPYERIEAR